MDQLESLKPRSQLHIMDLVREAGIDVSDWENFKGGVTKAKSNPKYCYNWVFTEHDIVVLSVWFDTIRDDSEKIFLTDNFRETSRSNSTKGVWKNRAAKVDEAVQTAFQSKMAIRTIINEGYKREGHSKTTKASMVKFRLLDTKPWTVTSYDDISGQFVMTRESLFPKTIDQFDIDPEGKAAERRPVSGEAFIRSSEVRKLVLERAKGKCEYCGKEGFQTNSGFLFLETHHIVPLSEDGVDKDFNVAALCPNHHREAHHGMNADNIRSTLIERITKYITRT